MVKIEDLRTFILVAELGSMRRAADHLATAPSVVSRQIARLEQVYDRILLERRPSGIALTSAGQIFLRTARDLTRSFSDLEAELSQDGASRRGIIRLHTIEGVTRSFLAPLIARFRAENPEIGFSLTIQGRKLVLASVEEYEADLGIIYDHFTSPSAEPVAQWKQPLLAFVRPGHPLLAIAPERRSLDAWPCAVPDQTFGIRRLVQAAYQSRGMTLRPVIVANQLQSLLQAAIEDDLITYMPLQAARHEVERGLLVPIETGFSELEYRFATFIVHASRPRAPHVDAFLKAIRAAIAPAEAADAALLASVQRVRADQA